MRSQKALFAVVGVVTVLALVSFALVSLGTTDNSVFPSSLNPNPGGTLALYRLLEKEGIDVERQFMQPRKIDDDVGMVLYFFRGGGAWSDVYPESLGDHYTNSAVIVYAVLDARLTRRDEYSSVETKSPLRAFEAVKRVGQVHGPPETDGDAVLESSDGRTIVSVWTDGPRTYVSIENGTSLLNRFLAHDDNAAQIVAVVKSLLPEGKKLVLPEYAYGVSAPDNLFTRLGPAYSASLIQLLLMLALVIYTLGKRFGYPDHEPPTKPGAKDFVRALSDAFRRGRCTDIVLDTELRRALRKVSRKMSLPADLSEEEKLRHIPGELGALMRTVHLVKDQKPNVGDTRRLLAQLDTLISEFESGISA